jgi:hypothetical protein
MNETKKIVKRQSVSKKLRFEVFKRDSFTCQYCGHKAPDVVLHIEHITPVAAGGKNTLMNLVTSCVDCNLGKGARLLSDASVVEKSQKQAELLQERREQIEMLRDWHIGLVDIKGAEFDAVQGLFNALTSNKMSINEYGKKEVEKLIAQFGLSHVLESLREGFVSYKDPERALSKLGGICACRKDPLLKRKSYILAAAKTKVSYWDNRRVAILMKRGMEAGGEFFLSELEDVVGGFRGTWTKFMDELLSLVEAVEDAA